MAWPGDSKLIFASFFGPSGFVVAGLLIPALSLPLPVLRTIDFAGLVAGRWRNPLQGQLSSDGSMFRVNFGFGNRPVRIRFSNPEFIYANTIGGQWRVFNVPVPYGSNQLPFDSPLVATSIWSPGAV